MNMSKTYPGSSFRRGFSLQSIDEHAEVFLKCIYTVIVQHGEDKNTILPDSEVYFSALRDKVSGK